MLFQGIKAAYWIGMHAAKGASMKAVTYKANGEPWDVIGVEDVPEPQLKMTGFGDVSDFRQSPSC